MYIFNIQNLSGLYRKKGVSPKYVLICTGKYIFLEKCPVCVICVLSQTC